MNTNRADIEFYRGMMEHFQAESASKSTLVRALQTELSALREENRAIRESHREDMEALRRSHEESIDSLRKSYEKTIEAMQASFEKRLDRMAEANAGLSQQLGDAIAAGKLARVKKYGRSAEQRNLLNNRKGTNRSEDEDGSDGTPPSDTCGRTEDTGAGKAKSSGRRRKGQPEGSARFDSPAELKKPLIEPPSMWILMSSKSVSGRRRVRPWLVLTV